MIVSIPGRHRQNDSEDHVPRESRGSNGKDPRKADLGHDGSCGGNVVDLGRDHLGPREDFAPTHGPASRHNKWGVLVRFWHGHVRKTSRRSLAENPAGADLSATGKLPDSPER